MEKTIDGKTYKLIIGTVDCKGCVALPELKQTIAQSGSWTTTLCSKLGDDCGTKGGVWEEVD